MLVMMLDVLGRLALHWSTAACPSPTGAGNLVKLDRAGDRPLQLLVFNEEFLVAQVISFVDCVPALCTHRPSLLPIEWFSEIFGLESSVAATPVTKS